MAGANELFLRIGVKSETAVRALQTTQKAVRGLGRSAMSAAAGFRHMREGFNKIRSGMMPFLAAGTAGSFFAVREAAQFEKRITTIGTVMGRQDFEARRKDIEAYAKSLALRPEIATSAVEVANAYEQLAKAGITAGADVKGVLPVALMLSRVEAMDTATSMDLLTSTARKFNLSIAKDTMRIADTLSKGANASLASIRSLGISMRYAGASSQILGISLEETTALLSLMANQGLKGSIAGTTLDQMFRQLTKTANQPFLKKIGVDLTTAEGKFRPVMEVVRELTAYLLTIQDIGDRKGLMDKLFGARGARAFAALAAIDDAQAEEMWAKVTGEGTGILEKAGIRAEALDSILSSIRATLGVIGIDFFKAFTGGNEALGKARDKLADFARDFGLLVQYGGKLPEYMRGVKRESLDLAVKFHGAIEIAKDIFEKVKGWVVSFAESMGGANSELFKTFIAFAILAPLIAPVVIVFSSLVNVIYGVVQVAYGMGRVLWRALAPLITGGGGAGGAAAGGGLLGVLVKGFGYIKKAINAVKTAARAMWPVLLTPVGDLWKSLKGVGAKLGLLLSSTIERYGGLVGTLKALGRAMLKPFRMLVGLGKSFAGFLARAVALLPALAAVPMTLLIGGGIAAAALYLDDERRRAQLRYMGRDRELDVYDPLTGGTKKVTQKTRVYDNDRTQLIRDLADMGQHTHAVNIAFANAPGYIKQFGEATKDWMDKQSRFTEEQIAYWKHLQMGMTDFYKSMSESATSAWSRSLAFIEQQTRTSIASIALASAGIMKAINPAMATMLELIGLHAAAIAKAKKPEVSVKVEGDSNMDGQKVGKILANINMELQERGGGDSTPWQRRQILERGAVYVSGRRV